MQVLRQEGIRFVVAPYEADAQLAYLMQAGMIQGVITEDSDTIPYGCDNVLYKMDKAGNGQLFRRNALGSVPAGQVKPLLPDDMTDEQVSLCKAPGTVSNTHTVVVLQLLCWCILCGCDYLPSLSGVGSKVALRRVLDAKRWLRGSFTPKQLLGRLRYHAMRGWGTQYEDGFLRAHQTFRHHRVYCPTAKRVRCLHPLPVSTWQSHYDAAVAVGTAPPSQLAKWVKHGYHWPSQAAEAIEYIGPLLQPSVAQGIAEGYLHPETHEEFAVSIPTSIGASAASASGGQDPPPSLGVRAEKRARQTQLTGMFLKQNGNAAATIEARAIREAAASSAQQPPPSRKLHVGAQPHVDAQPEADSVTVAVAQRLSVRKRARPLAEDNLLRASDSSTGEPVQSATSDYFPGVSSSTAPPACSPLQGNIAKKPTIERSGSHVEPASILASHMLSSFLYDPSPAKAAPAPDVHKSLPPKQFEEPQDDTTLQRVHLEEDGSALSRAAENRSQASTPVQGGGGKLRLQGGVSSTAKRLLERSQRKGSSVNEAAVRKQVSQMHFTTSQVAGQVQATPLGPGSDGQLAALQAFAYTGSEPGKHTGTHSSAKSSSSGGAGASFAYSPLQPSTEVNRGVLARAPRLSEAMAAAKTLDFNDTPAVKRRPGAGLRRPG